MAGIVLQLHARIDDVPRDVTCRFESDGAFVVTEAGEACRVEVANVLGMMVGELPELEGRRSQRAEFMLLAHAGDQAQLCLLAQLRDGIWLDVSRPDEPRPTTWEDVRAEIISYLMMLMTASPEPHDAASR